MNTATISKFATRAEPYTYAALRIIVGLLFAFHGQQKILGWQAGDHAVAVGSQLWIGGLIELFGGLLIAFGLATRSAAFLCSGTMAVAYFQFHWKLAFADAMWIPALNHGESAVLYCFVFLLMAARGGGPVSVDAWVARSRATSK